MVQKKGSTPYGNGQAPQFIDGTCRLTFSLRRPTLEKPFHFGVKPISQEPLGVATKPGITVIAGWDPVLPADAAQDYLYIRGE